MKSFIALSFAAAVSALDNTTFEYMKYVAEQGKNYSTLAEFNMRMELFSIRNQEIIQWNAMPQTSSMGHNFLSDWTPEEQAKLRGLLPEMNDHNEPTFFAQANETYNEFLNWCSATNSFGETRCTPVKNQGQCGGCWAFSATETVESAVSIQYNAVPIERSPQQLISCSSAYGNGGCDGGWYYYAWNYLQNYNLETEAAYPYSNGSMRYGITGTCTYVANDGPTTVTGTGNDYVSVGYTNEDIIVALNLKPCSIAVDASSSVFQSYTGGVLTDAAACGTTLDHAIVAVGYGTDSNGIAYFIVRNSWGASWGVGGFIYLEQSTTGTKPGTCGMNKKVMYPNVVQA